MKRLCGIDEAGRGPLAGPVTAGAVVLSERFPREQLRDSKKLTAGRRLEVVKLIMSEALCWGTGWAWPEEIDSLNIHHATLLAMQRAFLNMGEQADFAYVDGLYVPDISCPCEAVVKGDQRIAEVQAASILAKTVRDRWMERYSWIEPEYGFEKHKGYPTREHRRLIEVHGPSRIQRKSFRVQIPTDIP